MRPALNQIEDEGAANLARYYEKSLGVDAPALDRYEANFTLGLLAWRAGDADETRARLAAAALDAVALVERRDPDNTGAVRVPHSVALPFLVVLNFGDEGLIQRLAKLRRSQWCQPETAAYQPLADLLDALREHAVGGTLSAERLHALIALNRFPGNDLFYRPWVGAVAEGLLAVAGRDPAAAKRCLGDLLDRHETMACEGAWRMLAEGLLSFWALTLFRVAAREGLVLAVTSDYFPR